MNVKNIVCKPNPGEPLKMIKNRVEKYYQSILYFSSAINDLNNVFKSLGKALDRKLNIGVNIMKQRKKHHNWLDNFTYERERSNRLRRYFWWVIVEGMHYNGITKKWVESSSNQKWTSNVANCRTLRAFSRMLRKHPNIKGKARLVNKYKGHIVYG